MKAFVSHTSELGHHPPGGDSFVATAMRVIAGIAGVHADEQDTTFHADPIVPGELCRQRMAECDVYIGIIGYRHGTIVADDPQGRSFVEFEYDTAREAGKPCLVFIWEAEQAPTSFFAEPGWPVQLRFRQRLTTEQQTVYSAFDTVDGLRLHLQGALQSLVGQPAGGAPLVRPVAVPRMAPLPSGTDIERPDVYDKLKTQLLERAALVGVTTALAGGGGFGKTTLAQMLCADPEIDQAFPDGTLWVTLGEEIDNAGVISHLANLCEHLGHPRPTVDTPEAAAQAFAAAAGDRTMLLVIDDAWAPGALQWFSRYGAPNAVRLVTTRQSEVLPRGTVAVTVDEMTASQALDLLCRNFAPEATNIVIPLLKRCGNWPLLLDAANAWLIEETGTGASLDDAVAQLVAGFDQEFGVGQTIDLADTRSRERAAGIVLDRSIHQLDDTTRQCLYDLAIFPEDTDIPTPLLADLWRTDANRICRELRRRSLVQRTDLNATGGIVRLHDILRGHLRRRPDLAPTLADRHRNLLDTYRPASDAWADLPTLDNDALNYLWRNLGYHLTNAGLIDELTATVTDTMWLAHAYLLNGPAAVERDLELSGPDQAELVRRWRQSAATLTQFAPTGTSQGDPTNSRMVAPTIATWAPTLHPPFGLRLRPLWPLPDLPNQALLRQLVGHTSGVLSVAWSPDGTCLASASYDRSVRVWDAATGTQTHQLNGHTHWVTSVAWSPDGTRLASASHDGSVRVWDAAAGTQTHQLNGHTGGVHSVAWSPDGTRLATASHDRSVRVWDAATGAQTHQLDGHTDWVTSVAWSPDGTCLASASYDRSVRVWDAAAGPQTHQLDHTDWVTSVAWSPDGTRLASASGDGSVWVWDAATGTQTHQLDGHTSGVTSVAWSPDGTRLASASGDGSVWVWDAAAGGQTHQLDGHTSGVLSVAWSPDGTCLASASYDRSVRVWDAATGTQTHQLNGHIGGVTSVAWSPDGTRLASAGNDESVRVWDAAAGGQTHQLDGHTGGVHSVAWSPDGTCLASASYDRSVRVWDAATGTQTHQLNGHTHWVTSVAWSPDGTRLASASHDWSVRVWDAATGTQTHQLNGRTGGVHSVAWSPDGTCLASASHDGSVRVWDAATGTQTHQLNGHIGGVHSVAWSPDGTRLASAGNDESVRVWDAAAGTQTHQLNGHTSGVHSVAWSPDGTHLATASHDRSVRVWDAATGTTAAGIGVHGPLNSVAWAADDPWVALGGSLGIYVFDLIDS